MSPALCFVIQLLFILDADISWSWRRSLISPRLSAYQARSLEFLNNHRYLLTRRNMIFSRHFLVWRYSKLRYDLELRNVSALICFTFISSHIIYPDLELRNRREKVLLLFFFCIETSSCLLLGCSDFIRQRDHDLLIRQIIFKYWWLLCGKPFVFKKYNFRFIK